MTRATKTLPSARKVYRDVWNLLSESEDRLEHRARALEQLNPLILTPIPEFAGDANRGDLVSTDVEVRQDGHHQPLLQLPGDFQGCVHGRTAAHANQHALVPGKFPGGVKGMLIVDIDDQIRDRFVEDPRLVGLLHILESLQFVAQVGFHRNNLNLRLLLLEPGAEPHYRARGAQRCHQVGDFPAGLLPDFRACPVVMGLPVGFVIKLIGQKISVREFPCH